MFHIIVYISFEFGLTNYVERNNESVCMKKKCNRMFSWKNKKIDISKMLWCRNTNDVFSIQSKECLEMMTKEFAQG